MRIPKRFLVSHLNCVNMQWLLELLFPLNPEVIQAILEYFWSDLYYSNLTIRRLEVVFSILCMITALLDLPVYVCPKSIPTMISGAFSLKGAILTEANLFL